MIKYLIFATLSLILLTPAAYGAWPSAATTGVVAEDCPNFGNPQPTGGFTINDAGTIIENRRITGMITVNADNVTIRCVIIDANFGLYGINCITNNGCQNLLVENVEIFDCDNACITLRSGDANRWARGNKLHLHDSKNDLLKLDRNSVVDNSYLHGYIPEPDAHNDAVQTVLGPNVALRNNRIEGPFREQTSAYICKSDLNRINGVLIEGNYLSGGTFTLYTVSSDPGQPNPQFGSPTNVIYKDNTWEQNSWKFGSLSTETVTADCYEWSGNKFSDGTPYNRGGSPIGSCAAALRATIPPYVPAGNTDGETDPPGTTPTFTYTPTCATFN